MSSYAHKHVFACLIKHEYSPSLFLHKINKAGYTATSCGWVGRGGYARFPTFRLMLMDRRTDEPMDQRMDKASYRVACPQLKKKSQKR